MDTTIVVILVIIVLAASVFGIVMDRGGFKKKD